MTPLSMLPSVWCNTHDGCSWTEITFKSRELIFLPDRTFPLIQATIWTLSLLAEMMMQPFRVRTFYRLDIAHAKRNKKALG
jgi:hypothetical protein